MASCTKKKRAFQKSIRSSNILIRAYAQQVQNSRRCGHALLSTSSSDCSRAVYRDIYNQETEDISNAVAGLSKYIK